ncbi:3-hydroxyacyl-CoA dehydrogenase / enoyl-CoA hydratase / 3-hydroxybutyryl-CoA epimerase [Solimonas aquatica]|uniref:3-hydroxyacyl-CoA dehydrogenase / enoyl-CoA hydratase / 3-hydroxybutyryl-CoA epimerase n=1 Tax=Solimonas aquatica TaxID=489703 RepID=A0A1H9DKC0_9GAMM|nr:3-hydroxyacyl-CoA dehydrogenase NAD-binding domain-containing protein [Solimonas aquatica]SEQ13841.1 3-hydroxyacyl-CoA dehydrogenase / enoyl-CoA hydratase / 3-hydroxybutyryl-CoA epimerase [Solimonas aquatica]
MNTLQYTVDAEGIALIAFDLPGRPMNVLTPQLQNELAEVIEKAAADAAVKGIVLTSAKPGAFIAGADIKDMVSAFDRGLSAAEGAAMSRVLHGILRRMETCGKPVACAMNGLALGGGLEVALGCHYRVLAEGAEVGLPEVGIGLLPGGGGTQRLPRLIGVEKSLPLLLTGQKLKAAEALKLGVVQAVGKAEDVVALAREWLLKSPKAVQPWDEKHYRVPGGAGPLAPHAQRSFMAGTALTAANTQRNFPAPLAILSCVYEGTQLNIDAGLRIESKYFGQLIAGPVARNMMRTLFINKNAADKLARRPAGVARSKVGKLGVLGAGMMGAGIAYSASAAGIEVVLLDSTQEMAEQGKQYSARLLDKALSRGKTTEQKREAQLARIKPTARYADLAGCELVIEAVFENRAVKAEVTRQAAEVLGPDAIFASNTSSLPISSLAKTYKLPAQFIGLHFFSPVDKMPLVEVIMGEKTSEATLARSLDFVAQLRKTPIVVNDGPGFYTTRVFATFFQEGLLMLEEGIAPALIENAAKMAGMPVGPLAVSDEVSMAFQLKGIEQNLADGQKLTPHLARVIQVLRVMVEDARRIGRRGGAGFYDYPAQGKKQLWAGLAERFPLAAQQPEVEALRERFLTIQALETARAVEDGIVQDAADADIGSILGIGFPVWTGGTLSYIDTLGVDRFVAQCERLAAAYGERFAPSAWLRARAQSAQRFHPPMAGLAA